LERFFFLDDVDRRLVGKRRGEANVLGFGVQLGTVRCLGTFLPDPVDVPTAVVDYVAGQLAIADASCLKAYAGRAKTRLEHQWEIGREYGYRDFASAEAELSRWIGDRAWTTGEGPRLLFSGSVAWLRERRVLLPGVSVLTRLVAAVRDATTQRLWDTVAARVSAVQARQLDGLLDVPADGRLSDLERLRQGPTATSGKGMAAALTRVAEVAALGFSGVAIDDVPQRRLVELARWGMAAKAPALRRHPQNRRLATLLATAACLEAKATDDALELFDVLMANELLGRAVRESNKASLRRYPRVARDAAACAAAVGVLLEAEADAALTMEALWQAIDDVVLRSELRVAVANLTATLPPPDADPAGEWRAELIERYAVVRSFVPQLCRTIEFGGTAEAAQHAGRPASTSGAAGSPGHQASSGRLARRHAHRLRRRAGGMVAPARVPPGPARGRRPPRRLRVLRAGAAPPAPAPPGRVRGRIGPVGRPPGQDAERTGVGGGPGTGAQRPPAPRGSGRHVGRGRPGAGPDMAGRVSRLRRQRRVRHRRRGPPPRPGPSTPYLTHRA